MPDALSIASVKHPSVVEHLRRGLYGKRRRGLYAVAACLAIAVFSLVVTKVALSFVTMD